MRITFGSHYLLTISEAERKSTRSFYVGALQCKIEAHDHGVTSEIPENIDLFHFSDGVVVGVQYVNENVPTLDPASHRLAAWMEIKARDPDALATKLRERGVNEITDFWDKDHFYFHAPGGQVYRLIAADPS